MPLEIHPIVLPLPLRMGTVNCYLLRAGDGFLLIDSGPAGQRAALVRALQNAGCPPGSVQLLVLTHGDFDHTGNAGFLQQQFGVKIALHGGDEGMLTHGDMFWNRKPPNRVMRWLAGRLFNQKDRANPDHALADGEDLTPLGFDAQIIALPGHSRGSVGVLTAAGDLFCGDLLENVTHPMLNTMMDDPETAQKSVEKLKSLPVQMVHPGHGAPFLRSALFKEL